MKKQTSPLAAPPAIIIATLLLGLLLAACTTSSMQEELIELPVTQARPPASKGILADIANDVIKQHGGDHSGFKLLDRSHDGLLWRLALIDSAVSSLDIQTYLWYPDNSGRLILERAVLAAKRGVHVRMIIDDLLTAGNDQVITELQNHPNIEFVLFNPWRERGNLGSRAAEAIAEMERLNTRMHNKMVIADGNGVVIGGRNIGDHYFGLSHDYNFHDLDLLGFGHIARQTNEVFDSFWNSEWVVSAKNLTKSPDPEFARKKWREIKEKNRGAQELRSFPSEVKNWGAELAGVRETLRFGTSYLGADTASAEKIEHTMRATMFSFLNKAEKEVLITNAYLVPGQPAIDFFKELSDRGVKIKILTNSLASHDVPAVNSHYSKWRDELLNAGVELYELRADAQISSLVNVPPVQGEFTGLHTKSAVIDRQHVFVGSMNFDPRSSNINTEMGAFVHSPALAEDLAQIMLRDMGGENAWQVTFASDGKISWSNSDETVSEQPARNSMQRVMDIIFKVVPKEQY
ncbi:MAG: phospholipase D family protein [Thermodesulfobacteriota bacterium]